MEHVQARMLKVNLGSGLNIVEGWVNVDKSLNIYLSKFPIVKRILYKFELISEGTFKTDWRGKKVIRCDVRKGLPFESESVDFVYCSHLLEHLTYSDARKVCREVCRVLKKMGVFRVVVPDLKLYAERYVQGDREFFGNSKRPIADMFLESLEIEGLKNRPLIERWFYSLHKYMYDYDSLSFLLRSVGFNDVQRCNFRMGLCPDLEKIENRTKSVYIEAQK